MSLLLGHNNSDINVLMQQTDDRTADKRYQWDYAGTRSQLDPWMDGMLWGRARMFVGGADGYFNLDASNAGRYETDGFDFCGGQQQRKIIGSTMDSTGSPLGGCTVTAYVSSTKLVAGQTVSDSGGYYECCTPFPSINHYLVCYRAGSPDVAGTSVNTIQPV